MVHVEQIELSRLIMKGGRDSLDQAPEHSAAEGVEEKRHAGIVRKLELSRVLRQYAHRAERPASCRPERNIFLGDARQLGIQLNADCLAKRHLCGKQQSAAHPGTKVDEAVTLDRERRRALAQS